MTGRIFLGRYEVIHPLGEGGMGKVYLARDLQLNEPLAIKVMHEQLAGQTDYRQRFEGEVALLRRFQHPHAVQVLDASMEDPQGPCIIMEYLPGISLEKLLKQNVRFVPTRVYRFVKQLCDVLQAAHDQGIIHRDLKPSNLMILDADTPQERLKVLDFGIAKVLEPAAEQQAEIAVGTPGYMSPEQFRGAPIDHRSDLYSLGAIIYQLLTGRLPFVGSSAMEIMIEQATSPPPDFAELGIQEQMVARVEPVVRSALALDPAGRPASAREFFQAYEGVLTGQKLEARPAEPQSAEPAEQPNATVVHLKTYMAESVAKHKLKAFIQDVKGKIVQTSPGFLRIQLRVHPDALRTGPRSFLSWLGLRPGRGLVRMELHMKSSSRSRGTQLDFTVSLQPERDQPLPTNDQWKATCGVILTSLKQFLMAEAG